uniref:Uncharacterized protein n=1 Tax=Anguilla anguilla TaxID=7936 RepID=A0A0E9S5K0_ANGAN
MFLPSVSFSSSAYRSGHVLGAGNHSYAHCSIWTAAQTDHSPEPGLQACSDKQI